MLAVFVLILKIYLVATLSLSACLGMLMLRDRLVGRSQGTSGHRDALLRTR